MTGYHNFEIASTQNFRLEFKLVANACFHLKKINSYELMVNSILSQDESHYILFLSIDFAQKSKSNEPMKDHATTWKNFIVSNEEPTNPLPSSSDGNNRYNKNAKCTPSQL